MFPFQITWRSSLLSFLVSLVAHLATLVGLALLVVPVVPPGDQLRITAIAPASEPSEAIESLPLIASSPVEPALVFAALGAEADLADPVSGPEALETLSVVSRETIGFAERDFGGPLGSGVGNQKRGRRDGTELAAQFFGVKALGRKFVFIVDSSTSMRGSKFLAARAELIYALNQLSQEQSFFVFFFDLEAKPMPWKRDGVTEPSPLPPSSENLQRVRRWLLSVELGPNTLPFDAVRQAVEMQPDAIYLLSDGIFKDGGMTEQFLREYSPRPIVHTIAFWDLAGASALQRIARESGGTFRFVPPGR